MEVKFAHGRPSDERSTRQTTCYTEDFRPGGQLRYLRESKDIRHVSKNPLTAPGGNVEVERHRATTPAMSID